MKDLNLKYLVAGAALITVFAVVGCTSKNAEQPKSQTKVEQKVEQKVEEKQTPSIGVGTQNMIDAIKEMKEKLEAKDEAGAIKEGAKLEENWKVIEDAVKDKNKDLYGKVEDPLDAINGALKVKPLDEKVLIKNADELNEILEQVRSLDSNKVSKEKKVLSIEDGSKNMRDALKEMKEKLGAKLDEAAIKEGSKLEENWSVIEDAVKDKNKVLYGKVEDPLDTINAAIKVKPLDSKILITAINDLDKVLAEVEKIK